GPQAKELHKVMTQLGKHDNVKKVYLVDVAHPTREPGQGGVPPYHDNVGIAEVRPSTRVASVGSTVFFTVTVVNYSPRDADVRLLPYDNVTGQELKEKEFETDGGPAKPLKVPAGKTAQAVFSLPVRADLQEDGKAFARIGVRLLNAAGLPLENDGLAAAGARYSVIEGRQPLPRVLHRAQGEQSRSPRA